MTISDDEHAIRELVADWMAASRDGNTEKVMSLMADDVIFLTPGRGPFGKDAFRAAAEGLKQLRLEGTSNVLEIRIQGDWAYLRNFIDITVTPPGGDPVRRSGHTLSILRKEPDGRWLLIRDANLVG
ncbi:MAG TPA: SgcJ/EcaC family oxidoreductase [Rhizomicrobium sp.]|nr:SgcJ/EcaC family oxidoreductase [Rhizomicrobium sp.]